MTDDRRLRAAGWMLLAQALFTVMAIGARFAGSGVPWQEIAGSRFLLGALVALGVARARGASLRITRQKLAWTRSLLGTVAAGGTFYVLASPDLAIGDAVTIFATAPIFIALLSWPLLGEKVHGIVAIAIALAFAGIVAIARPSFHSAGRLLAAGALAAVAAALAMMWLRKLGPNETSEAIVFHFSTVGTVVMLLLSIPVWRTPGGRDVVALLATGLSAGVAQLAMTRAYALEHAAPISALQYANVVFTRLVAWPLFGELPGGAQLAGSVLVLGAGVALAFRRS